MSDLSVELFNKSMVCMADVLGIKFPHDHMPVIEPNDAGNITEAMWGGYSWDGSEHGFSNPDSSASPKPNWSKVVEAAGSLWDFYNLRESLLALIRLLTKNAITAAYGAGDSWQEEIQIRLSNRHTSRQDNERDRLRVRYRAVKAEITAATTIEQLEAIQVRIEDGTWADDPAPPS